MAKENINNLFFDGSYQHAWKRTIPPGLTEAETDLIVEEAGLDAGSRVLDLMCGYGRHAIELAKRKIAVTAVDNLQSYVDEIKEAALQKDLPVEAVRQDILDMRLTGQYDAAICMGNSFAFFGKPDALAILRNISAHLRPHGMLLINSWTIAEIAIRYFKEKDWHFAGGYKCILDNKFLFSPARIESEQTLIAPGGEMEMIRGIDYIYTLDELEEMLQAAGLYTRALYSTPRKRKFSLGDSRIYIVTGKLPL